VQKKPAERKGDRQKRYTDYTERQDTERQGTERKARSSFAASGTRHPPSEEQDQPERTMFGREEPHFNLFQMLSPPFGRSFDGAPDDRDD